MIVTTIETQYNKMKEEKKKELEAVKQRTEGLDEVRAKEMRLKLLQGKINKMKQQINNAYDVDNVLGLENELAYNRQIIDKLMAQNQGLVNVKKGQSIALKKLNHDADANQRLDNIKQELAESK